MQLRKLTLAALLAFLPAAASAQSAGPVVAAASKAMGADTLNSITYSGTARNGAFGQSKAIGDPMGPVNVTQITQYTRTINFGTPADASAARLAGDGADAAADGAGRPAAHARRVQPEHHRHAGQHQLEPGAEHLDDALGLPEGRGGQQRHRAPAGRPAGRVVLAGRSSRRRARPIR